MSYSGFTVMLVDDEVSILKAMTRLLRPLRCEVVSFSSPVEAIEAMDGIRADLVISDMRMPEMGGEVFLEAVAERWPDIERVVMTGYADMQASIDAINRGRVSRFLTKPWNDGELLDVVRKGFELAKLRHDNAELQALTEHKNRELETLNASLEQKVQERTLQLRTVNDGLKSSYRSIVRMFSALTARRMGMQASEQNQKLNLLLLGVAKACQIEGNQLKQLYYAWQLRNIGKLSLSDDLLNHPYVGLSAEQQRQFHNHPLLAQAATLLVKPLHGAGKIIAQHKEYLDGTGYPHGITGESIHRLARILCVVNDYIELTTGTYQDRAFSTTEALDYLKNYATEKYDDDVVVALESVVNSLSQTEGLTKDNSVGSQDLHAGMKLSRDLISGQGILLLSAGQQLDNATIERVREIEFNLGETFDIYIHKS